jgi:ferrous iron transport protein A
VLLNDLPLNEVAMITSVDWSMLGRVEARRLRDLGIEEGVEVEPLHRGWFLFRDPIAIRVGRMNIAIRTALAAAIEVQQK